mmetsp:Transcript_13805/g.29886  ORF Transcript_13805/g.29886 Transcript_13805/m.29886 type:complete len:359 (-) Transcript_13805:96-1172(-)
MDPLLRQEELVKQSQGEGYVKKRQAMVAARLSARGLKGRAYYDSADHSMQQQKKGGPKGPIPPHLASKLAGGPGGAGSAGGEEGTSAENDAGGGSNPDVTQKPMDRKFNHHASESGSLSKRNSSNQGSLREQLTAREEGEGAAPASMDEPANNSMAGSKTGVVSLGGGGQGPSPVRVAPGIGMRQQIRPANEQRVGTGPPVVSLNSKSPPSSGVRSTGIRVMSASGVRGPAGGSGLASTSIQPSHAATGPPAEPPQIGAQSSPAESGSSVAAPAPSVKVGAASGLRVVKLGGAGAKTVQVGAPGAAPGPAMPKAYDLNRAQLHRASSSGPSPLGRFKSVDSADDHSGGESFLPEEDEE